MPTYMDQHKMGSITPENLREMQNEPKDEFGVTHKEIFFNKEEDKTWCVLEAPSKDAVIKHHEKAGIKPDWVHEVKSSKE